MKNNNSDIINYVDFCLKKNSIRPKSEQPSSFILNRWLTMVNNSIPIILNATTNRWLKQIKDFNYVSFYRKILPSNYKNITYIKKKENLNKTEETEYLNISKYMECSYREIMKHEETLEYLNNGNK